MSTTTSSAPCALAGPTGALLTLLPGAIMRLEHAVGDFALSVVERLDEQSHDMLRFGAIEVFKILVLQALYSLADEGIEFQIKGRLADPVMPPLDSSVQKLLAGARLPKRSAPACSPTPQPQR